jgi:hypothetical protein
MAPHCSQLCILRPKNPPLPLVEVERIEVKRFSDELNRRNPHPPLFLLKGEAKTSRSCDYVKF